MSCANLISADFEITTPFCFRKTPRDDILIKPFSALSNYLL